MDKLVIFATEKTNKKYPLKVFYSQLYLLVKRLLLIMVLMSLSRLLFYIFNFSLFANLSFYQVIQHHWYGVRFDLAIVFLFNMLFILLSLAPLLLMQRTGYQAIIKGIYIVVNSILIALNLVDTKFYEFEGKRLTADIFSKEWLGDDFFTMLPTFVADYWYLVLVFVGFVFLLVKLYPKARIVSKTEGETSRKAILKKILISILVLFLSVIAGRGGAQLKPIGIIAAARYTSPEFIALILNSPFTIVKTFGDKPLPIPEYFTLSQIDSVYNPVQQYEPNLSGQKTNVVIIILESFGKEYSGFLNDTVGYTPHLDSIMKKGLYFNYAFANGKRSIEALPSILSGIPALMDNAFVNTKYSSNTIEGLGTILKEMGYSTSFYHGGKNGTMGFDNFVKYIGIENYYGINEYPSVDHYDGNWGILDEPYLQYFCNNLSAEKEPFFSAVFTLSSHHPYKIPEKYEGIFPKGDLINHESIAYADFALGKFFETAAKQPWYRNTLFVLTADHTAQPLNSFYKSNVGKYAIPLIFYAPGDTTVRGSSDLICQQTDIFPSILHYLGYNKPFVSFGKSVFETDSERIAFNYLSGMYQIMYRNFAITFNALDTVNLQPFSDSAAIDELDIDEAESLLKAVIQQFNYRMEHNLMQYHGNLNEFEAANQVETPNNLVPNE